MRPYELMYIISPDRDDEGISALIDRINGTIESAGGAVEQVIQDEPWGRRRLAYPIGHFEEGHYILTHFSLDMERLGELERVLKLSDGVLRHMLTRRQE